MEKLPRISEAELQVMFLIWENDTITAPEIVERLSSTNGWSSTTIYTFINRLVKKKAIETVRVKSSNVCRPLISFEDYRKVANSSFLKKIYNGSMKLMLTSMIDDHTLTDEEINELRQYLDDQRP